MLNSPPPGKGTNRAEQDSGADLYRELFERSADAILIIEGDTFTECNQATVSMLRYETREQLLQTHPSELSPEFQPDGRASFEKANEMMALAFAQGSHRFEWDHRRADGTVFPVEVLLTAVARGEQPVLHVVWRDISERKQLERELRHAQKLEAIGRLTGGIAHDFNNLLVAINGYAELLQMELPPGSELHEYASRVVLAGDRATGLVKQLLAFSRKQVMRTAVVDLNAVLQGIEPLLSPMLGDEILFERRYHGEPLPILADPGRLEQVVINLISNARDAISGQGVVTLATRIDTVAAESALHRRGLAPGSYAVLTVRDSGAGILPADLPLIFDPFFSTKDINQGTGLGLSTVHGIVMQSGGEIVVDSWPAMGSTFAVYLPLTDEMPAASGPAGVADPAAVEPAAWSVLLVEDDPAVLALMETTLRRAGYRTQTAANGRAALELVESGRFQPNLLITDVIMPEMNGPQLADALRDRVTALRVLYTSGYEGRDPDSGHTPGSHIGFMQKPFGPKVLLERVRGICIRA